MAYLISHQNNVKKKNIKFDMKSAHYGLINFYLWSNEQYFS